MKEQGKTDLELYKDVIDADIKKSETDYINDKTSSLINKFLDNDNMSFDKLIELIKLGKENNKN